MTCSHERGRPAAHRGLSRDACGRAGRGRQHARRLPARSRRLLRLPRARRRRRCSAASAADVSRYLQATRDAAGSSRPRARGGFRRCASSTNFSRPKASSRESPATGHRRARQGAVAAEDALRSPRSTGSSRRRRRRPQGVSGRDLVRAVRHHCLIEMLYATGMRVSELVSLPRAVLAGDPRVLTIKGKGGRERLVPLNAPARARARPLSRASGSDARRRRRAHGGDEACSFPRKAPKGI